MNDLITITLGDYIDLITDYHANGAYENLKENITLKYEPDYSIMIRTLNFESNDFKRNLIYLNEFEYNYLSKSKVQPYDLIMNKIANPGSVYLMPNLNKPVSLAMNLFLIRFNKKLDQKFMFYLMKINEPYIKRFANGTTTKTITKDAVRGLEFKVPHLSDQVRIASLLHSLDSKIELNNRINAELEAMAKTLYDYWFVQFDFPYSPPSEGCPQDGVGIGKPYKSSGGKMVWNDELKREIPEGWEVDVLGNYLSIERGISYKGTEIGATGIPMVNLNSFHLDGRFKYDGIKFFSGSVNENKIIKSGDLMIATTDVTRNAYIIGKSFILPDLYEGSVVASCDIAKVNIADGLDKYYLDMMFNSDNYHRYIKGFASGTLVLHLDTKGIEWYKCVIPPKELLNKFSDLKKEIDSKKTLTLKENQQLSALRDWLLPMLMNGQVKVGDLKEEYLAVAAEPGVRYGE